MKRINIIAGILMFFSIAANAQPVYDQGQKFRDVLGLIKQYYTDTVNDKMLVDDAIVKVLEDLDPHSAYVKTDDVKRSEEPLQANFEGIGVSFQLLKDTIVVLEIISGGPSQKVGLLAGDRIVKVDDTTATFKGLDNNWVMKHLRGNKGTKVKVSVLRKTSQEPIDFVITRDKIPIYSIEASYMAAPGVGYIKLVRFAASSMQEYYQALEKLKGQGMQHLVLDLQDNTGGYLYTAIDLCNQFLEKDQLIVYTQGLHSPKSDSKANGSGSFKTGKLVVMINEGSASASEILSGCIQDNDRGLLVGRRTWGKGLVQKPFALPDGSQIKLTTAHYYVPSGRSIQRPYEKGKKEYNDEYTRRYQTGELFGADTFKQPDSLKAKTIFAGRTVYGGGGVSADLFIPIDTTMGSRYYNTIVRRGILNQFCVEYLDKNRQQLLNAYPTSEAFIAQFRFDEALKAKLMEQAEADTAFLNDIVSSKDDSIKNTPVTIISKNGKDWKTTKEYDLRRSAKLLETQAKAILGRNMFDNSTFWQVYNNINNSYQKAVEVINNDRNFDVLFEAKSPVKTKKKLNEKEKRELERWRYSPEEESKKYEGK
jgi:carboxyl-terminal processing protease